MIDKLKKNNFYIKYGVIIVFIAIIVIFTVKTITYSESILSWFIYEIKRFLSIISPVLYAVLLAYLLYQPVKYLERFIRKGFTSLNKNLSNKYDRLLRIFSVIIVLSLLILALILIYNFLIPPIINNIKDIINSLPEFQAKLKEWANAIAESLSNKNIDIENTGQLSNDLTNKIGNFAKDLLSVAVTTASDLSAFVLDFVVTIILTIYFLIYKEDLVRQLKKFRDAVFSKKMATSLTRFLIDVDDIVGGFIVGEILDSTIVGIVSTCLLLLVKHPFALLIGVIAGVTNVIPYVGPIIGAALAFLLGIFTSVPLGIIGAILLLLYQQIDGNFVQPKIVGDKIGLSPVWILIAVLVGGSYFGALGMILSMPIVGLIRVYFNRYAKRKGI